MVFDRILHIPLTILLQPCIFCYPSDIILMIHIHIHVLVCTHSTVLIVNIGYGFRLSHSVGISSRTRLNIAYDLEPANPVGDVLVGDGFRPVTL